MVVLQEMQCVRGMTKFGLGTVPVTTSHRAVLQTLLNSTNLYYPMLGRRLWLLSNLGK
jgi:hypothetical protein